MNKRHLSSIRRSPLLRVACILILAVMFAPAAMAATALPSAGLPIANGIGMHAGSAILAGGLAGAGLLYLRAPASGEGGDEGGGEGSQAKEDDKPVGAAEALAAIEDKTLPMSQRLGVAMKALRGIPPAEQFAKVKSDLEAAQTALKTRDGELAAANKQIAALQADVKQLEEANAKLEKDNQDLAAKEQDLGKRASNQAKQIVRGVGIEASKLPAAAEAGQKLQGPANQAELESRLKEAKTQKERSQILRDFNAQRAAA